MATVRAGDKAVLLVVDVQVGVVAEVPDAQRVVANVARAVSHARESGMPLIWVQHTGDGLERDSADWQWAPPLQPAAGETLIHKHFNSSFEETSLEEELARLGASHVVLAGCSSNWCIRATAYGALDRGYDLTLLADAHGTGTMQLPDGRRIEAAGIVEELNTTMRWLRYPGRRNAATTVDAFAWTT